MKIRLMTYSLGLSLGDALLISTLRLFLDPLQRVGLPFKSEDGIDLTAAPQHAHGMALPDCVLPNHKLIIRPPGYIIMYPIALSMPPDSGPTL
jgi:hypothetical protein